MGKNQDLIGLPTADNKVSFTLSPKLWDSFDSDMKNFIQKSTEWREVKFLSDEMELHEECNTIPTSSGGVYLFIAKPGVLLESNDYVLYIGRAYKTQGQNLKKRCREYHNEMKIRKRPLVHRMLTNWGSHLYVKYIPLDSNDEIKKLEEELINKLIPPFNDRIPNKEIQQNVKALRM